MAAIDVIASELLKSANEADLNYKKTRDQAQRDKAIRLRKIVENLKLIPLGASDLNSLTDVTISSPTNGQVLTYNSTTSQWENQAGGGGGSGYVPYTGATGDVNLGTHQLLAARGTFANNGSSDTLTVNHTSGSGYGIIVTKGGANEALYVNKTSGSGNAMTVVGGRTSLVDLALSSVSNAAGDFLTLSGGVVHRRTAAQVLSDISVPTPTLAQVTTAGNTTTNAITVGGLTVATNLIYTDTVNGRVGFGTTSPAVGVDVRNGFNLWVGGGHYLEGIAASGTDASLVFRRAANNGWVRYALGVNGNISFGANISTGEVQLMMPFGGFFQTFYANGSEAMRIPTSRNVLIGTTTDAGYKLDVNGTARVQGAVVFSNSNISNLISIQSSTSSSFIWQGNNTGLAYQLNNLNIQPYTGSLGVHISNADGSTILYGRTSTTGDSAVGVGTMNPVAKFEVSGNRTAASLIARGVYFNNTLVAAANNDVLVGLDINPTFTNGAFTGVENYGLRLSNSIAFFGSNPIAMFIGNNTAIRGNATTGGNLYIDGSRDLTGTIRLRASAIDISGATSMGALTATAITVNGSNSVSLVTGTGVTSFRIGNTTSSSIWFFENNRNAPAGSLEITNSISSPGMTFFSSRNVAINSNTDAGYKLDVVGADSRFNGVRVGLGAGGVSTNTVVGANALNTNTTGARQVAIGLGALQSNTIGTFNTAVGYRALVANDGDRNVALGYQALVQNGTGQYNTGIGFETLFGNIVGSNNVALGYQSLFNNTASNNTAVGYQAGFTNTSGTGITAIGYQALRLSTGANNTALGFQAGNANTTGANNIFIGYQATGVSATESNRTWIGNSSTTSTWLAGNVLIGTTTNAGYKLDVAGTIRSTGTNGIILHDGTYGTKVWSNGYIFTIEKEGSYGPSTYLFKYSDGSTALNLNTTSIIGLAGSDDGVMMSRNVYARADAAFGFTSYGATTKYKAIQALYTDNNTSGVAFNYKTGGTDTEAMRITSAGYIGVGTTSPTDIFHIVNNTNGNKFGRISAGAADASAAWVAQNDQVDNIVYRVFGSGVSGTQMGIALARSASLMANLGGSGKFLLGTYSNTDFVMGTGNAEKMRIVDSTGNVLIGTTTDLGNKLEVSGSINSTGYKINNTAGYTGILTIVTNPPGQQNVDIQSGIIVNVF